MGRPLNPKIQPYSRADGTVSYRVRIRVGGAQSTETFDSLVAAETFVRRVKDPNIGPDRAVEMRDREDERSANYVPTLAEMLTQHVEELTGVEPATRAEYLRVAGRSFLPVLGSLRVDELDRRDVARWVNQATGAPKTIRNQHSILSATLNSAIAHKHIVANPARGTRLPRAGEEEEGDVKLLTHSEFDVFLTEVRDAWRPMVVWMFGTGTRFGETTAVQRRDLDLEAGHWDADTWESLPECRIVRAWKKGNVLGPPKSKAGRRTLIIPPEVVDVIGPMLPTRPDEFVFRTETGRRVTHNNFYNRIWKPAALKATICPDHRIENCRCLSGKPERCLVHTKRDSEGRVVLPEPCGCAGRMTWRPRIHDARHTHASWLIALGIRLDVIQARLGHEDYLTTQRLYGHLLPDARAQAGIAASAAFSRTSLAAPKAISQSTSSIG